MCLSLRKIKSVTYVAVIGTFAFCTFYWYMLSSGKQENNIFIEDFSDYWRWECNSTSKTCERRIWRQNESGQTLKTCQMACGLCPIWPLPNGEAYLSKKSVTFNYNKIKILSINGPSTLINNMLKYSYGIFLKKIKPKQLFNSANKKYNVNYIKISISVITNKTDTQLRLGTDESYKLLIQEINSDIFVSIKSGTYFGARHGLETLSQLIWLDEITGKMRIIDRVKITDTPSFTYRGILIDTANHFISIKSIKRTLQAMSLVKMNILHLHLTDSFNFPFYFKNIEHAIYGAENFRKVYTINDLRNIVDYAIIRGIRVVIEVENPGHMRHGWNWGHRKGIPDLNMCSNVNKTVKLNCNNFVNSCNQINPSNNKNYELLNDIFGVINNITKYSDINHLGGNKIDFQCWETSPDIKSMESFKQKGVLGVLKYHQNKIYNILSNTYKGEIPSIIFWSDYFKKFSAPNKYLNSKIYVAQINSDSSINEEKSLINNGYRVIISHKDKLFLNRLTHWSSIYDHRPWEHYSWSERQQILGGEACLWTNLTDDHSLDSALWPRAAALAEVLWSDSQIENFSEVTIRLQILRERLIENGIHAATIAPKWCVHNPGFCI